MKLQRIGLFLALVASVAGSAAAQKQALPIGWDALSAEDFAKAVEKQKTQGPLAPELRQAIANHAVELLFNTDQTLDQLSYADIGNLVRYGKTQLTPDQTKIIGQRLAARNDGPMRFQVMRNKITAMTLAGAADDQKRSLVASWVNSGRLAAERPDISATNMYWLYDMLSHPYLDNGSFSVVWSGNLRPPRTGTYVFSLPSVNVNSKWKNYQIEVNWTVTVDGAEILRATPEKWKTESSPVDLTADQPVRFRAEAHYKVSRPMQGEIFAILYWRGPGITTSVVPAESWTTLDGAGQGLSAEYTAKFKGSTAPQTLSRTDPTIDFFWAMDRTLMPRYAKEQRRAVEYFRDRYTEPAYLAACAQGKTVHPFLKRPLTAAEFLTSSERRNFLKEVLQRNAMVAPLNEVEGTALFTAYRLGAETEALGAFGAWCTIHRDIVPDLPRRASELNLFAANRIAYVHLAHRLVREFPTLINTLETKYLETEDGSCSLPAAYTLAYAYRVQKKTDVWVRLLEVKLGEEGLTGAPRVNWLIARAMAQELRGSSASQYAVGMENASAGIEWLARAQEIASSEPQRLQVLKEFLARDLALNHFDVAKERLHQVAGMMQQASAKDTIRLLGVQTDRIAAKIQKHSDAEAEKTLAAYRVEIERRQQVANDNGDVTEAARLGQLLEEAK